jgi:hypothetical protein
MDDEQHYITYRQNSFAFHWHSENARFFEVSTSGKDWVEHIRRLAKRPRELGQRYFVDLRAHLVGLIQEYTEQPSLLEDEPPVSLDDTSPLAVFRDLRYLLLAYFGLEAFIFRPRPESISQTEL